MARSRTGRALHTPRWRQIVYSLLPLALIVAALEAYLRVSGYTFATCKWEKPDFLKPGGELIWKEGKGPFGREIRTRLNNLGLRGSDWAVEDGSTDILILGDSVTFGEGVMDGAEFPARVGQMLNNQRPSPGVRVVNGGVPGYGITEEIDLAKRLVPRISPGLVLLTYCANDVFEILRQQDPERYAVLERERFSPLFRWSATTRACFLEYFAYLYRTGRSSGRINGIYPLDKDAPEIRRAWESYFASVLELAGYLKSGGVALGLIDYPDFSQVVTGLDTPERYFRDFGERHNIPVLELLDDFRQRRREGVPMLMPDGHPDARAHQIIACAIVEWLTRKAPPAPFPDLFRP